MRTAMIAAMVMLVCSSASVYAGDCSNVTQTPSGSYTLSEDWTTNSDVRPCFRMEAGRNLNLNGYQIKCTKASGACSIAVQCADNGSLVKSSKNSDGGHIDIDGPFDVALQNCTTVQNMVINNANTAVSSLSNADKISGNVITKCNTRCIDAQMTDDTDRVENNFISPGTGRGIQIKGKTSGTLGPLVWKNVIMNYSTAGIEGNSTVYRIDKNLIAGAGASTDAIAVSGSPTSEVCEDDAECDCDLNAIDAPVVCLGTVLP